MPSGKENIRKFQEPGRERQERLVPAFFLGTSEQAGQALFTHEEQEIPKEMLDI